MWCILGVCPAPTSISQTVNLNDTYTGGDLRNNTSLLFTVAITNRGNHTEVIQDAAALAQTIALTVQSLGTGCSDVTPVMVVTPAPFPRRIAPRRALAVNFNVTFNCANDPLGTTRLAAHNDYRLIATVNRGALDSAPDDHPADDICPHDPLGIDPASGTRDVGCGAPRRTGGGLGAEVVADVIVR